MVHKNGFTVSAAVAAFVISVALSISSTEAYAGTYDPTIALRALHLSSGAYSKNPQACLSSLYALTNVTTFSGDDGFGNSVFGYSAVNIPLKEIVVSFRGTKGNWQLFLEMLSSGDFVGFDASAPDAKILAYFADAMAKLIGGYTSSVVRLVAAHPDYTILFTGHSLGGALASLASLTVFDTIRKASSNPMLLYTFGEPRVGNFEYSQLHDSLGIPSFRVVHHKDVVPHVPFCDLVKGQCAQVRGTSFGYHHAVEVYYASFNSPATYRICTASPINEDATCSNAHIDLSVDDHLVYFNIDVSKYCPDGLMIPQFTLHLPSN